jgi:hypothetical protein
MTEKKISVVIFSSEAETIIDRKLLSQIDENILVQIRP